MKKAYLLYASLAFALGEAVAKNIPFVKAHIFLPLIISLTVFLFLLTSIKKEKTFIIGLFSFMVFLGMAFYASFNVVENNNVKNLIGREVFIRGVIMSDPLEKKSFIIESRDGVSGKILVRTRGQNLREYRFGDVVELRGTPREIPRYPLGRSDYRKYMANKKVYAMLYLKKETAKKIYEDKNFTSRFIKSMYYIREKLDEKVLAFFKPPYEGIVEALFLGKRTNISKPLKEALSKTGTIHILAISGLHVGIIYFILRICLKILHFGKKPAVIFSVIFLASYAVLTGLRPSILRASVMFSFLSLGELLGRKTSIYNLIGISALAILFVNPNQLFETGFILSYGAVLSIVCISPVIYRLLAGKKEKPFARYAKGAFAVSLSAWVGLLGIVAHYFGIIAPITVAANIVIVPLLFVIMGSGALFFIFGFFCKYAAVIFASSTTFLIFLLVKVVEFMKMVPCAYFNVYDFGFLQLATYYIALLVIILCIRNVTREN